MPEPSEFIKPEVKNLTPYTLRHRDYRIKMNQNENPFGFPQKLKEEVWRRVRTREWARYPDFFLREVTEAIARYAQLPADWVLVGNGSNEFIQLLLMVTLSRGERVVVPVPTFTLYRLMSTVMGAEVIQVPLNQGDFSLPTERIIDETRSQGVKLIFLCSPNNPTGNSYPEGEIRRVIEKGQALVIIDQAYRDFSDQNLRHLLDEYQNVIILRTFSKAMSLAGARLGYLLGPPSLVRQIAKAKLPYGLNILSETAALVALENLELLERQNQAICSLRDELHCELKAIPGVHPYPSQTNFILCRFDMPEDEVFEALLEREGILVRDVSGYPLLAGHLRISVGRPEENEALIRGLREICDSQKK